MQTNEIIKLKHYQEVLGVSRRTAGELRKKDRVKLKLKKGELLLMSHFKKLYSLDILEKDLILMSNFGK